MKQIRTPLSVCLALLGLPASAWALTDIETNSSIPFSFLNPGARSLGMGSAFVALADDATAAYTNPAGLTQLVQREVSLEARHISTTETFVSGGSATFQPLDLSALDHSDAGSSRNVPSFVSVVWPLEHVTLAAYRHELTRFATHFSSVGADLSIDEPNDYVLSPFDGQIDLHIVDYSGAAAIRINEMLSLGVSLSYYESRFSALRTQTDEEGAVDNVVADDGSDGAFGATLGIRARLGDQWSAGFAYRLSPRFDYRETQFAAACEPAACASLERVRLRVPDVLSAGLSWRPLEALVVNADVNYIRYAQITSNVETVFDYDDPAAALRPLRIHNGTEFHVGGEYSFASMEHPLSLRLGVWHEPRHSIAYEGVPTDGDSFAEAVAFSGGVGAQTHFAFGIGMAFKNFQIDAAADHSSKNDTLSVSAVYRF